MALVKGRELKRRYEADGAASTVQHLREALTEGHLKTEDFSIKDLAENLIEDGREYVAMMNPRYDNPTELREAAGAVDSSAFSNITGQIVYSKILEASENPQFIWPELVSTVPTQFNGEKVPGISGIGDEAETIDEGQPYPLAGVSQEYISTPETDKRGMIVPVTKEAIFFDRTNILLDRCSKVGEWLGLNKEKRCIDIATGQTNNWNRNGTAYNTYAASGGHGQVNQHVAVLTDYTDINEAEQLFNALTDWNTGEPVLAMPTTLLVPQALLNTAEAILESTEMRTATASSVNWTVGPNRYKGRYRILTSPMVYARTSSSVKWFLGDFKKGFAYMENWPITVTQAPAGSEDEFNRDIVAKYKCSERGVAAAIDPLQAVYSVGSG